MPRVAVITDSNSGITQMDGKNMGISVLPMPFTIDDKTYYEDINLTREEFFQMMADGRDIMTSQPSPGDVMDLWDKALEKNDQVVYIPMSSGLSSSCQNARMLANDYKGRVFVVNNQRISVTQKRSVQDAMNMAENGYDAARIRDILERERLDAFAKARTLNQGKQIMINTIQHDIETLYGGIEKGDVWTYAVHAQVPEAFSVFKKEVETAFPTLPIEEGQLSLSVCCHIGPGALAMATVKKCEHLR